MKQEMIKVNASDFAQLVENVEMIKDFLFSRKPYPDPEGELSDWAKKELSEARVVRDEELLDSEEVKQVILDK